MASFVYNQGATRILNGNIDMLTDTIKCMLIGTLGGGYTENRDHDFVDSITAATTDELTVSSGYVAGFGGSGRKTLALKTVTESDANDRAEFDAENITWTALATGDTIDAAALIKEVANDAASPLIAHLDLTDTPTNGGDITLVVDASGFFVLSTV